eukprot:scaffold32936_cov129-Isochrysis_galbana.AAC.4
MYPRGGAARPDAANACGARANSHSRAPQNTEPGASELLDDTTPVYNHWTKHKKNVSTGLRSDCAQGQHARVLPRASPNLYSQE